MTILQKWKRREARKSIKSALSLSQLKRSFPRISELDFKKQRNTLKEMTTVPSGMRDRIMETPQINAITENAMQVEVEDLLFDSNGTCTVNAMATALSCSDRVITLHGEGEAADGQETIARRFVDMFRPKNRSNAVLQRRYSFLNAMSTLEKYGIEQRIDSWSAAKEVIATVVNFSNLEANASELKPTNSVAQDVAAYMQRHELRAKMELKSSLSPSERKWKQISSVQIPKKLSDKHDGTTDIDASLTSQIQGEYEKRDKKLQKSTVLCDLEQRMLEKEQKEEAKKRASSLMRPLTEAESSLVEDVMYGGGPPSEVLATMDADSVQRASMHRLQPGQWLNDEVIHYFFLMLSKRDEELCQQDARRKRSHFFKSFFVTKLLNEGNANPELDGVYDYKNVKRWSKKVPGKDIFKLDKIFFPINQGLMHWICAVAYMSERRIQLYDSMGSQDTYYQDNIFRYIQDEHQAKKGTALPDQDQWQILRCARETPRQRNGYDCGVYTCMFADFLAMDMPLLFNQEHVTQFRERIALSICNGKALS